MAKNASNYTHGQMDIHQQAAAFHGFVLLTKWGSLALACTLVLLTLWFCTDAGFWGALIPTAIVAVLGTVVLREKPGSGSGH